MKYKINQHFSKILLHHLNQCHVKQNKKNKIK